MVQTLKELRPGVLRLMSTNAGLGNTVDDLLAPPLARQGGTRGGTSRRKTFPSEFRSFLSYARRSAPPWIVAPTAMNKDEVRKLAEYLAGTPATVGGAVRAASGHSLPWTQVFPTIHIELGNETWNGIFLGESMDDMPSYGRRANAVFAAFRAAVGADANRFDLSVGAQSDWPARDPSLLAAAPGANSMAIAPYMMHTVNRWATDDELYGALLAEPEYMSRVGQVQATQNLAGGRRLAVYEVNLHTTEGRFPGRPGPLHPFGRGRRGRRRTYAAHVARPWNSRSDVLQPLPIPVQTCGWKTGQALGIGGADGRQRPQAPSIPY